MSKLSPMMQQYLEIKREHEHCLVFFRLGDFYELFFDDAKTASKELDITLTGRDCGLEKRAPMCGVPFHAAEGYIAKLIEKGYKVAICEQVEDPKQAKGIVKREVVRIVTPGTVMDKNSLDEGKNNFLVCLYADKAGFGIAYVDVTTGEFYTSSFLPHEENLLLDEILKLSPREIIANDDFLASSINSAVLPVKPESYYYWAFSKKSAYGKICEHFNVLNLNGLGLENDDCAVCASGALLVYLHETQKTMLNHILSIKIVSKSDYLSLDQSTRRNLELTETMREKSKKGTLLWVLDKTKTPLGARLLRRFVEMPLISCIEINKRLDSVEELKNAPLLREELKEFLSALHDFERTAAKIAYKTANARDLLSLSNDFYYLPFIKKLLAELKSPLIAEILLNYDDLADVCALLKQTICDEPPAAINEGGFIRDGYNLELDKLRGAKNQGTKWILEMENAEREKTGIKNLKIRYNKVFGYYIELSNSNKGLAPEHYIRRQTLANCERYITTELKDIEETILGADEKIAKLELEIFQELILKIADEMPRIQFAAHIIATIDVISALAETADKNNYVRPVINNSGNIEIKNGRHPVVEHMTDQNFVPNDTSLDSYANRLAIITGPNMAGKSTFMRQTALIVLMAQIGSFIPADYGQIGVVDKIFTRVGASDDLASGQSTFMVEMSEVANILNNSTANSLIILDEIGRGTSTYDGLSIAWAVLEYIAGKICAKTLFSTHYHELTEIEGKIEGVNNYRVLVEESGGDVIFLRKIVKGGAGQSYGIHVAKLAGVPSTVLDRAGEILNALNNADIVKQNKNKKVEDEVVYYGKKKNNPDSVIFIQDFVSYEQESLL